MVNPAMMGGNFNPLLQVGNINMKLKKLTEVNLCFHLQQTNMYSSPMFPATGPAAGMQAPIGQVNTPRYLTIIYNLEFNACLFI